MFRIYNDWLVDFCRHYPDRHIGLACLPYGDIDAAVREIHRVAKMGPPRARALLLVDMDPMWHPAWEPRRLVGMRLFFLVFFFSCVFSVSRFSSDKLLLFFLNLAFLACFVFFYALDDFLTCQGLLAFFFFFFCFLFFVDEAGA